MTPAYNYGTKLASHEKAALTGAAAGLAAKLLAGGRAVGRFGGAVDGAAASVLRGLGSGSKGVGSLFNRLAAGGRSAGQGIQSAGTAAVNANIKNPVLNDVVKMLGHGGRTAGRAIESSGGGAGLASSAFNALGKGLHNVANVGKGVPTLATGGLGYGGVQAGVLQNPLYVTPKSDHIDIDVKSPVKLPKSVREMLFGKEKLKRRPLYSATGRRLG
jgi:hypothetical protein